MPGVKKRFADVAPSKAPNGLGRVTEPSQPLDLSRSAGTPNAIDRSCSTCTPISSAPSCCRWIPPQPTLQIMTIVVIL